ncbi:MAG: RdgB/HAM1 family non-canonical purine NTP pyrophosphatase, partial [Oscillospiraceae bacterium]|nr:RdgB/HAM1 family non-canonical purine NTP pyrophosphatase [Oscillospiraceae bacterium]
MKLIIASNNKNKIREIKEILSDKFSEILSLSEAGISHETIEDGETFIENARKKALEIAEISGEYAIADDSGLCVDALGGAPGVYSARYSGEHGNDEENNLLLLKNMENEKNRKAHYTAAIVLASPDGKTTEAEGYMLGEVMYSPKGNGGFGYDPLIFLPEMNKTV